MKKELGFYEYSQLAVNDQYALVFKDGVFLGVNEIRSIRFALYNLFNFYVEVGYNAKDNRIANMVIFFKKENF